MNDDDAVEPIALIVVDAKAWDDIHAERDRLRDALVELEQESRRPFATIEHIGYLARRALDT